jgi:cephalosporin-C deacetylase-like acetyl esterase
MHQAFAPELANKGFIVLAPDSLCFEDRRKNVKGTTPHNDDLVQHLNEMTYRLLNGKLLISKIIEDSSAGISLLFHHNLTDKNKIGMMGHSYGGSTVLFHLPFDPRIKFAVSSGALCSFEQKMREGTGIEFSQVIPGFLNKYEMADLLKFSHYDRLLIISASEDKYTRDAENICSNIQKYFIANNVHNVLELKTFKGGHSLNKERFDFIIDYLIITAGNKIK